MTRASAARSDAAEEAPVWTSYLIAMAFDPLANDLQLDALPHWDFFAMNAYTATRRVDCDCREYKEPLRCVLTKTEEALLPS